MSLQIKKNTKTKDRLGDRLGEKVGNSIGIITVLSNNNK